MQPFVVSDQPACVSRCRVVCLKWGEGGACVAGDFIDYVANPSRFPRADIEFSPMATECQMDNGVGHILHGKKISPVVDAHGKWRSFAQAGVNHRRNQSIVVFSLSERKE